MSAADITLAERIILATDDDGDAPIAVSTDDGEHVFYAAWISENRWNGWAVPYFRKSEADRIVAYIASCDTTDQDPSMSFEYDEENEVYILTEDDGSGVFITTVETSGEGEFRTHNMGNGWVWEEYKRPANASDVPAAVARAKAEILADLGTVVNSRGEVMPTTITSFSELHDYVDANMYGGLCDEGSGIDWVNDDDDATNAVQNAVNAWLAAGRPEESTRVAGSTGLPIGTRVSWTIQRGSRETYPNMVTETQTGTVAAHTMNDYDEIVNIVTVDEEFARMGGRYTAPDGVFTVISEAVSA